MYLPLFIFWALLNQQMSRFVFQAQRMDGDLGWYTIKPDQMVVLGPFFIMVLVPVFNKWIFPFIALFGLKTPLQKMGTGMFFAGITFLVSAYVEVQINSHFISILYLFPQFFLAAFSEVFLWVPNVAFAYTEAPKSMKSVVTSMVYVSLAGGSLIVFLISGAKLFSSQTYEFIFYAGLMFIDTIVFMILAMKYKYVDEKICDKDFVKT
jgi:proton-dependent oligopeptide transporter, POT family